MALDDVYKIDKIYKDWEIAHQRRDSWSSIPGPIGSRNIGFWGEGKTGVPKENHSGQMGEPSTNSTYIIMVSTLGFEPRPHWWEASAFTIAPPLLLLTNDSHLDCKTVGFFLKISKEIDKAWRKSSRACEARNPSLLFIKLPHSDVRTIDQCLRCGYSKWKMKLCNLHTKKMMVSSARMSETILLCTEHIVHTIPRYLMISEWSISHK